MRPAIVRDQSIGGGEIDARLPFFVADALAQRGHLMKPDDSHERVSFGVSSALPWACSLCRNASRPTPCLEGKEASRNLSGHSIDEDSHARIVAGSTGFRVDARRRYPVCARAALSVKDDRDRGLLRSRRLDRPDRARDCAEAAGPSWP